PRRPAECATTSVGSGAPSEGEPSAASVSSAFTGIRTRPAPRNQPICDRLERGRSERLLDRCVLRRRSSARCLPEMIESWHLENRHIGILRDPQRFFERGQIVFDRYLHIALREQREHRTTELTQR